MELLILFTVFILTLCYLFYLFKPTQNKGSENLPLPPGHLNWPFKYFDTLDYLKKARANSIHKFIAERKQKHKTKCFKTSHLGQNMVFLTSAEGNKFLFSNDHKLVRSWWPMTFLRIFENAGEEITLEEVMRARKQFHSFFNEPDALARHISITDQVVQDHFKSYWVGSNNELTVYPLARKLTFDISCRLLADIRDREILDVSMPLMGNVVRAFFAFPINFPGTILHRAIKSSRKLRQIFVDVIKERKMELLEKKNLDERNDILSRILVENYQAGRDIDDVFLAKNLVSLLSAAYDNPSVTITSIMKNLAELPEIYDKVHKEQIEIAKLKAPGEYMNMEDIKNMKYSMNVLSESLRIEPPASGTFREVLDDFNYEGFRVPKGWKVHWSVHATHRNPEYFSNPDTFDPSRFERNDPIVPYSYVPFGGGHHICPGKDYAKLLILIFMHHVVRNFKWEKVNPDEQMMRAPNLFASKGLPVRLYPYGRGHKKN